MHRVAHGLLQSGHVPCTDDDASGIRVGFQRLDHIADLVDVLAIRRGPTAPLHEREAATSTDVSRMMRNVNSLNCGYASVTKN